MQNFAVAERAETVLVEVTGVPVNAVADGWNKNGSGPARNVMRRSWRSGVGSAVVQCREYVGCRPARPRRRFDGIRRARRARRHAHHDESGGGEHAMSFGAKGECGVDGERSPLWVLAE